MNRVLRVAVVSVSVMLAMAMFTSGAEATDLEHILTEAQDSTYSASRLVVSVWGGQTQITRQFVEHADGMEMIRTDENWTMTGNGKAVSMGEDPTGFTFVTYPRSISTSRYTVVEKYRAVHMSRPCLVVDVMEGDVVRASLVIDDRSGALLIQELYADNGDLYRRTTLSDFRAYRTYEAPMDASGVPAEVVMPEKSALFPETIAGYELVDSYSAPGGAGQGFYTDGLFRFSLFILDGSTVVSGFEDSMIFATGVGLYEMVPTAQAIRLHWHDGSKNYVLVGDLPPDHVANVLRELPLPRGQNMWAKLWGRLFG